MRKKIIIFSIVFLGIAFLFSYDVMAVDQYLCVQESSPCVWSLKDGSACVLPEPVGGSTAGSCYGCYCSPNNSDNVVNPVVKEEKEEKVAAPETDPGKVEDKSGDGKPASPAAGANVKKAGTNADIGGPVSFENPLNYNTLPEILMAILVNLQSFLALIAVIIIIVGGVMYMLSAGNEKMIERAKSTIGGALIGLAIILAAPSFLKQIKLVLGGGMTGVNADQIINQAYTFKDIAINVINFLLSIIGILGIIALVVGGIMYVTAYGNEDRVESGKKIITNALIGILIAFGALILVRQIAALLGAG